MLAGVNPPDELNRRDGAGDRDRLTLLSGVGQCNKPDGAWVTE